MNGINRRRFAAGTAAGLAAGTVLTMGEVVGREPRAAGDRLMLLGLNALARAHEMDYFTDGHRGAAFIAAQLMCVENQLDEEAFARIEELFDLNWSSTALCEPFPNSEPAPERVAEIGEALLAGGEVLRQVGHNAIFAMLAIKAFRQLPQAATPERIEGVRRLIEAFTPWRDVEPADEVDPPSFSDAPAASRFILREADAAIDRWVGFGQGYAGHMLTFGQALVELADMGDVALADGCRTAFRKYVTVTRLGPEEDARPIREHRPSPLRPNQATYWQQRGDRAVGIGHVFKYPYSYYDLLRRAADGDLQRTLESKAHAIF